MLGKSHLHELGDVKTLLLILRHFNKNYYKNYYGSLIEDKFLFAVLNVRRVN
jgi:hypothetical protein